MYVSDIDRVFGVCKKQISRAARRERRSVSMAGSSVQGTFAKNTSGVFILHGPQWMVIHKKLHCQPAAKRTEVAEMHSLVCLGASCTSLRVLPCWLCKAVQ